MGSRAQAGRAERLLWLPPILLSAWCYHPITKNYFYGDDLYNLYEIVNRGLVEYLVKPYGMHLLAARNLVYFLCYRLFGTNPEPYFWVVLFTHLLNVFLLFRILGLFTGPRLACVGATLWGTSPACEGALGWFSVYGQVLATTMVLWVLYRLAQIATTGVEPPPAAPLRWAAMLFIASVSFGTGIGAAMAFPIVAFILLPPSPARRRVLLALILVAIVLPVLYPTSQWLAERYHAPNTGEIGNPIGVLLQWQVTWQFTIQLIAYGLTSLLLGPFQYPLTYPSLPFVVLPMIVLVTAIAALTTGNRTRRRQLLAVLTLALACYGIIAAGRAGFFLLFGKNIVASARYHYAATAALCVAIFVIIATLERWRLPRPWPDALTAAALVLIVAPHAFGSHPIDHHPRERAAAMKAIAAIREEIDAAPEGTEVYIKNRRFNGVGPLMLQRPDLFPGFAAFFAIYFPDVIVDGRRVFFVVWDRDALAAAQHGRKTGTFVVGPGALPASARPEGGAPAANEAPPAEQPPDAAVP